MEKVEVTFPEHLPAEEWIKSQPLDEWKEMYEKNGYLRIECLIEPELAAVYRELCEKMMTGEVDTSTHRHDLGSHVDGKIVKEKENICQIMWPSLFVRGWSGSDTDSRPEIGSGGSPTSSPLHERVRLLARALIGEDSLFDYDMMIAKEPGTSTPTPWHQDAAYWPPLPDLRSMTAWVSMDWSRPDNGCMWFVPGSHKTPIRRHWQVKEGHHVLQCDCSESEGLAMPLPPGGATLHHGGTLHYTRGNTSATEQRRAYIVACRPGHVVRHMRGLGFDHGKAGIENVLNKDNILDKFRKKEVAQ